MDEVTDHLHVPATFKQVADGDPERVETFRRRQKFLACAGKLTTISWSSIPSLDRIQQSLNRLSGSEAVSVVVKTDLEKLMEILLQLFSYNRATNYRNKWLECLQSMYLETDPEAALPL